MVDVRQASIFDLDLIAPLFDQYRQFYRRPSDLALSRQFLRDRFEHDESVIFLAFTADGAAVGFTQLYPSFASALAARSFILNDLFVHPDARRQGVGAALLSAAARHGRAVGAVRLTLSTEVTNTTAQALYEVEGWVRNTEFFGYSLAL